MQPSIQASKPTSVAVSNVKERERGKKEREREKAKKMSIHLLFDLEDATPFAFFMVPLSFRERAWSIAKGEYLIFSLDSGGKICYGEYLIANRATDCFI